MSLIEIQNINPIHKGNVLASCDVYIKPWHMFLREITIFQKGTNRWVNLPSRSFDSGGEKKYVELVQFDSDGVKNRFRAQVLEAVDKYLATNPDMTPEPVINENDDLPF